MFERFTERARKVVVRAQDEARFLKQNYIGTEHLLLGLIDEKEGIAAKVLVALNIPLDDIRAAKTDREAMVLLGQLLMTYIESNNINLTHLKNRQDRHEWSNRICFITVTCLLVFIGGIAGSVLALHVGG